VLYMTFLLGHLVAFLVGLIPALLVRDLLAVCHRDVDAVLDWNLVTHWVGDLSFLLFLYILTVVIWVVLAGGPVGHPFLVVSSSFPVVLAVLLVACVAFRLCVGVILSSELIVAFFLVVSGALLLIDGLAHLPCCGVAFLPVQGLTLPHIFGVAHIFLSLHILGVPDCGLLCPASYG